MFSAYFSQPWVTMLKNLLTTSFTVLILLSCLKSEVTDQLIIPPIKLMTDFAKFFHSKSIIFHSYVDQMMPELVKITKQINKQGYYFAGQCPLTIYKYTWRPFFSNRINHWKKYHWLFYVCVTLPMQVVWFSHHLY